MAVPGFERLQRIIRVPYTLRTEGSLSIGTGKGDGVRDNLIIREGHSDSAPVVSGSSVKGMVRSTVEAILADAMPGQICVPFVCLGRERALPDGRKHDCGQSDDAFCPACQMFGNTRASGRVSFRDAHLPSGADHPETTDRTHVALRRDTKTAAGGALMTTETLPPGIEFEGEVVLTNPEDWMVGAVIDVLSLLDYTGLGAKKTAGYGEVTVTPGEPEHVLLGTGKVALTKNDYLAAWHKYSGIKRG